MNYQEIITIEPGKRGGRPCIRGMRISAIERLIRNHASDIANFEQEDFVSGMEVFLAL